jgi:hypothetical protein
VLEQEQQIKDLAAVVALAVARLHLVAVAVQVQPDKLEPVPLTQAVTGAMELLLQSQEHQ